VSVDRPQNLRVLEGRFTLEHAIDAPEVASEAELLALVFGPDGRTAVRCDDRADNVDGRVVLEVRPVGLEVSETIRVTLPNDRLVSRLGTAAE
jgi:hypothetical protein